jgi:hypothetical protein
MIDYLLKPLLFSLLALIALLLSVAFVLGERPFGIPIVLLICSGWGVLLWRNGRTPPAWPMVLLLLVTALANLTIREFTFSGQVPLVWRYLAAISALLLWDLSRFYHRLQNVADGSTVQPLIVAHLWRLGALVLVALGALAAQRWLPLSFNFDLALVSGLALIFGLNALLRRLQTEEWPGS